MGQTIKSIIVVLHDLPLGGSERIAVRLANRWAERGVQVTLFVGSLTGELTPMIDDAVEVVTCDPPIPRARGSRRRLGVALSAFLAKRQADVLFVPGNYHWPVLHRLAWRPRTARPAVVVQISTPLYRHGRGAWRQIAYNLQTRWRLRGADRAVALSPSMQEDARRALGTGLVTEYLPLPALDDVAGLAPTRAGGRLIVAAGRLVKEKGFDVALRAFARLGDPSARLAIVGEGPQRAALASLALSLGVAERVSFPGYAPDIGGWLEAARVFLLSSYYEGYGAVVLEALAAGRPVVATDGTPAADELLVGLPGCAVAAVGDAGGLAAGLARALATAPPDPRRLANRVAGFRIGPIAEAYLELFGRAVSGATAQELSRRPAHVERRPAYAQVEALDVQQGHFAGARQGVNPGRIGADRTDADGVADRGLEGVGLEPGDAQWPDRAAVRH